MEPWIGFMNWQLKRLTEETYDTPENANISWHFLSESILANGLFILIVFFGLTYMLFLLSLSFL